MDITAEIRGELARQGRTQEDLALEIGVARQTLSEKMQGRTDFKLGQIETIAKALRIPLSSLIARAEQAAITAAPSSLALHDAAALAVSALALPADEADGPSEAELEAHVDACDGCTCAEDALEHARLSVQEAA